MKSFLFNYRGFYSISELSDFDCPSCSTGKLSMNEKSILERNTSEYEVYKRKNGPDSQFYQARFSTIFNCSNQNCFETISCIGTTVVNEEYEPNKNGEYQIEYTNIYKPLVFDPPVNLFSRPEKYPNFLKKYLNDCSSVFWLDSSACGNKIRVTLEALLTHFKIPKQNHKKKLPKNLHERIVQFGKTYPKHQQFLDQLLAIKWLGNNASHNELSHDDVLKALEILEYVLDELFDSRKDKIMKMSKVIVKSKGKRTSIRSRSTPPF